MTDAQPVRRTLVLAGHKTSLRLERAFWRIVEGEAERRGLSVVAWIEAVDAARQGNLASAVRVAALRAMEDRVR